MRKTLYPFIAAVLFAVCIVSCHNDPLNPAEKRTQAQPQKGELVYYAGCMYFYFESKLGDDFASALQNLIASREELSQLGDNLYVKQMEITTVKTDDNSKVVLLQFFVKDADDKIINVICCAHDAIDTNGNHYHVVFCEDPSDVTNEKNR